MKSISKKLACASAVTAALFCAVYGVASHAAADRCTKHECVPVSPGADNGNLYDIREEIRFQPLTGDISRRDLGIQRLREAGCSDFTIECFSDEELELLADAVGVFTCTSYFAEAQDGSGLQNVSRDEYMRLELEDPMQFTETPPFLIGGRD